jgi:hypothetical protein
MILLSAINWTVSAIIWLVTPVLRLYGFYALLAVVTVVLIYLAWSAMRRLGKGRRTTPT